jgi:hypothetical protein
VLQYDNLGSKMNVAEKNREQNRRKEEEIQEQLVAVRKATLRCICALLHTLCAPHRLQQQRQRMRNLRAALESDDYAF